MNPQYTGDFSSAGHFQKHEMPPNTAALFVTARASVQWLLKVPSQTQHPGMCSSQSTKSTEIRIIIIRLNDSYLKPHNGTVLYL